MKEALFLFCELHTGNEMQAVRYEPPKAKAMIRPAYLYFIPSPAALSFNFAVQSYQPTALSKG